MSTLFINYKPTIIDGIRKFGNRPYWLAIFLAVSLNDILLFSKDLITFWSSLIKVIPEPVTDELQLLIFLPITLIPASTRISLFNFSVPVIFNSFANELMLTNDVIFLIGVIGRPNTSIETNRNYPNWKILENWIFEDIILADEPFAKAWQIFENCVWVNNNLSHHWNLQSNLMKQLHFFVADFDLLGYQWDNFTFTSVILSHF